jgi:thiol:disulfide interchange protein
MAEGDKKKSSMPRITGETVIYAIPGLALVAFFAWVLFQMGSQNAGLILMRMLVGILVVLAGGGLVFWLIGKAEGSSDDDDGNDEE